RPFRHPGGGDRTLQPERQAAPERRWQSAARAEPQGLGEGRPGRFPEDAERQEVHHGPEVLGPVPVKQPQTTRRSKDMRNRIQWLAGALLVTLFLAASEAQPPGRKGPPPDRFGKRGGPGPGIDRIVDDLKLSGEKRDTVRAAVGAYQDNVRRLTDL